MTQVSAGVDMSHHSSPPFVFGVWRAEWPADRAAWETAWEDVSDGDVFSHPAYLDHFADTGQRVRCAYYEDGHGSRVIYGFLMRPIDADACGSPVRESLFDITTPLLYGGPLVELAPGADPAAVSEEFWSEFGDWAQRSGVISEFIRMDPVGGRRLPYPGTRVEQAPHVVRTLTGHSDDELQMAMSKSARRNVRRARAAGMEIRIDREGRHLEDFLRLYYHTMERTGAAERFYYPREFFDTLHTTFTGRFTYLYAMHEGRPVSTELMLMADRVGYAFLGATDAAVMQLGTNTFISYEAFLHARELGLDDYVLTGGVTNSADDNLLRFKRSLVSQGSTPYHTGHQVFDDERYAQLSGCARRTDRRIRSTFFPAYRDTASAGACVGDCARPTSTDAAGHADTRERAPITVR